MMVDLTFIKLLMDNNLYSRTAVPKPFSLRSPFYILLHPNPVGAKFQYNATKLRTSFHSEEGEGQTQAQQQKAYLIFSRVKENLQQ